MSDYVSHIILLPQNADWRWYETLRPYLEAFRVTVTQSADDAGRFHGAQHTMTILQSPDAWPDGIIPFFRNRYPNLDPWVIVNKPQVIEDFKDAMSLKLRPYYWRVSCDIHARSPFG